MKWTDYLFCLYQKPWQCHPEIINSALFQNNSQGIIEMNSHGCQVRSGWDKLRVWLVRGPLDGAQPTSSPSASGLKQPSPHLWVYYILAVRLSQRKGFSRIPIRT